MDSAPKHRSPRKADKLKNAAPPVKLATPQGNTRKPDPTVRKFRGHPLDYYTQVPNELFDEIMQLVSPIEFKVIMLIARKTYGWRKDEDQIGFSQIEDFTGLSRSSALRAVSELEERKLIGVARDTRKPVKGQLNAPNTYYISLQSKGEEKEKGGCQGDTTPGVRETPPGCQGDTPPGVRETPPRVSGRHPQKISVGTAGGNVKKPPQQSTSATSEPANPQRTVVVENPLDISVNRRTPANAASIRTIALAARKVSPEATDEELALGVDLCPTPREGIRSPGYFVTVLPKVIESTRFLKALQQFRTARAEYEAHMQQKPAPSPPVPLDPSKPWDQIRQALQSQVSVITYANWFADARQLAANSKTITVAVQDRETGEFLKAEYADVLDRIREELGIKASLVYRAES